VHLVCAIGTIADWARFERTAQLSAMFRDQLQIVLERLRKNKASAFGADQEGVCVHLSVRACV
jgi:hypothetical protein